MSVLLMALNVHLRYLQILQVFPLASTFYKMDYSYEFPYLFQIVIQIHHI